MSPAEEYEKMYDAYMKLKPEEHVVTAWAETASGPGWSNSPIWYIVTDGSGKFRRGCLQPDEQTDAMRILYSVSAAVSWQMSKEVARVLQGGRR